MPAAAEAPPKPGAVSPESTAPESTPLSESMAELESLDSPEPEQREPDKKTPPKKEEPKKTKAEEQPDPEPEEGDDDPHGDKELESLADKAKPGEKKVEPEKPVKAAELRSAYEKSKETIKSKDAEIIKLKADLKAAQSAPKDDPEKATLLGKLQETEKREKALQERLRLVAYQQSEDFVKNYEKPWQEAWQAAASEIQELSIELEDGTERPATVQDLVALSHMKIGEARKYADKMFGAGAPEVMAHLRKLRDLSQAQHKALEDAKTNSEAHFKAESERTLQERQKAGTIWKSENESWRTRFPKFFQPTEGDEEGNALLAKGYEMADKAFSGNGSTTPEERVKLHAEVRNKAAAFPRLALELKRARGRIKELEKSLAEFEQSEPPTGAGSKTKPKESTDMIGDAMAELDALDKK